MLIKFTWLSLYCKIKIMIIYVLSISILLNANTFLFDILLMFLRSQIMITKLIDFYWWIMGRHRFRLDLQHCLCIRSRFTHLTVLLRPGREGNFPNFINFICTPLEIDFFVGTVKVNFNSYPRTCLIRLFHKHALCVFYGSFNDILRRNHFFLLIIKN